MIKRGRKARKARGLTIINWRIPRRTFIYLLTAVLFCVAVAVLLVVRSNSTVNSVKDEISKHLRDTYGSEQFIIKDIRLNGSGLGINGIWQGTAYSKDSNLEFYVSKSEGSGVITDNYTNVTWAKEETDRFAPEIKNIIPTAEVVKISMGVDKDFLKTLEKPLESYAEARKNNQDKLSYTLTILNKGELSNAPNLLFRSVEKLKASGLKTIDLQYAEKHPGEEYMRGKICEGEKVSSVEAIDKCIREKATIKEGEL